MRRPAGLASCLEAAISFWLVLSLLVSGCGLVRKRVEPNHNVPIEARPTPTPPPEPEPSPSPSPTPAPSPPPNHSSGGGASPPSPAPTPAPAPTKNGAPVETALTETERRAALQRIVADTTAASAAVRRCSTRTLLPDQESVYETTRGYLIQARAALIRDQLWQAESLARKARQLALSLDCR